MTAAAGLEPAIPPHLRQPRTQPAKTPLDYKPPFPAYIARFPREAKDLVIAIFGVQARDPTDDAFIRSRNELHGFFPLASSESWSPRYHTFASLTDKQDYFNASVISYWQTKQAFDEWADRSGFNAWWSEKIPGGEVGWFREVFLPTIDRFETVFSDDGKAEGAAHMQQSMSGEIQEHVYWGSMRDRLPISQVDPLHSAKVQTAAVHDPSTDMQQQHIRVPGLQNLTVIRSGQDWSNTTPEERKLYLETMHPVLIKGMDFLRDYGHEVGCFSCRFMDAFEADASTEPGSSDKTFGLAYFDDMASLEKWSKAHKTHLDIFGRFLQYAAELQGNVSLKLFHEVFVLEPQQQSLEYIGCHEGTGMLASL